MRRVQLHDDDLQQRYGEDLRAAYDPMIQVGARSSRQSRLLRLAGLGSRTQETAQKEGAHLVVHL